MALRIGMRSDCRLNSNSVFVGFTFSINPNWKLCICTWLLNRLMQSMQSKGIEFATLHFHALMANKCTLIYFMYLAETISSLRIKNFMSLFLLYSVNFLFV
jgi:hypothetical protein